MVKRNAQLQTPLLFLVFNRLDTTKRVFEEIRRAKPKQLFVAADGPRNKKEKKKTGKVREYVTDNIDWDCEVKKLFRDENLGCKYAVSGAIDWFFDNVEQGIILEDDCLPSQSFFRFCEELLEKYKDNKKIMHISGTNIEVETDIEESYFFSKTFNVWGWATWKRAWKHYDVEMKEWPKHSSLLKFKKLIGFPGIISFLRLWRVFNLTYKGKIDTWDYQWDFACRANKGLSIIPKKNLIKNIGFEEGTHMGKNKDSFRSLERKELEVSFQKNCKAKYFENYKNKFFRFFSTSPLKKFLRIIREL